MEDLNITGLVLFCLGVTCQVTFSFVVVRNMMIRRSAFGWLMPGGTTRRERLILLLSLAGALVFSIVGSFTRVDSQKGQKAREYLDKAIEHQEANRLVDAVSFYTQTIGIEGISKHDLALAYTNRAFIESKMRRYDRAVEDYTRVVELEPGNALAYNGRGNAHAYNKQYVRAIQDFTRAIELQPKNVETYYNRGLAYAFVKSYARAIDDFDRTTRLDPHFKLAYYGKAYCYALLRNTAEACKCLQSAIEKGYDDWNHIESDPDLSSIRTSACYKRIISGKQDSRGRW